MTDTALIASWRLDLPRAPHAGADARRFAEAHLAGVVSDAALAHTAMVVSELVNNAYVHGTGRMVLELEVRGDRLRVEVVDGGSGRAPAIRAQAEDDGGGWGLRIVDALALRWGAHEGTTHVWAELPTRSAG